MCEDVTKDQNSIKILQGGDLRDFRLRSHIGEPCCHNRRHSWERGLCSSSSTCSGFLGVIDCDTSKTPEGRNATSRVQGLGVFSFSSLGCSKCDFFGLNFEPSREVHLGGLFFSLSL